MGSIIFYLVNIHERENTQRRKRKSRCVRNEVRVGEVENNRALTVTSRSEIPLVPVELGIPKPPNLSPTARQPRTPRPTTLPPRALMYLCGQSRYSFRPYRRFLMKNWVTPAPACDDGIHRTNIEVFSWLSVPFRL